MTKERKVVTNDDDFLWECALLESSQKSTTTNDNLWIVPNGDDVSFYSDKNEYLGGSNSQMYTHHIPYQNQNDDMRRDGITIQAVEIRDFGVMDIVGGEIWEAAYLLCAYILSPEGCYLLNSRASPSFTNNSKLSTSASVSSSSSSSSSASIVTSSVFELGAGLAIPSLLITKLAHIKHNLPNHFINSITTIENLHMNPSCIHTATSSMYISDNEPRVLENLKSTIELLFPSNSSYKCDDIIVDDESANKLSAIEVSHLSKPAMTVNILHLDWHNYSTKPATPYAYSTADVPFSTSTSESILSVSSSPLSSSTSSTTSSIFQTIRFDYLIGAALCYAPSHAIALANTILHAFHTVPTCKEAIIIQIQSRAGFSQLLTRLKNIGLYYTLAEISEELYASTQDINVTRQMNNIVNIHFPPSMLTHVLGKKQEQSQQRTDDSSTTSTSKASPTNHTDTSDGDTNNEIDVIESSPSAEMADLNTASIDNASINTAKVIQSTSTTTIRSDKEAFVILRIFRNNLSQ